MTKGAEMKQAMMTMVSMLLLAGWVRAGMIVYSYDEPRSERDRQHRLALKYSANAQTSGLEGANYNNQGDI